MKILIKNIEYVIELNENKTLNLLIENKQLYISILGSLFSKDLDQDETIIFSDGLKELNIQKDVESIINPFNLDCNEKRIINRLYQEMEEQTKEIMFQETSLMTSALLDYMEEVCGSVPYNLDFEYNIELKELFKVFGVRIESKEGNLCEKIVNFVKSLNAICGIRIFVFNNLKLYLEKDELLNLYEFCRYQKVFLINIEGYQGMAIEGDECYVIDNDLCIFHY